MKTLLFVWATIVLGHNVAMAGGGGVRFLPGKLSDAPGACWTTSRESIPAKHIEQVNGALFFLREFQREVTGESKLILPYLDAKQSARWVQQGRVLVFLSNAFLSDMENGNYLQTKDYVRIADIVQTSDEYVFYTFEILGTKEFANTSTIEYSYIFFRRGKATRGAALGRICLKKIHHDTYEVFEKKSFMS